MPVLEVNELEKWYRRRIGLLRKGSEIRAVRGVSFALERGEVLALVGESGCGKSTIGKIIADVLEPSAGRVLVNGRDLPRLKGKARDEASLDVQIIHQDPYAALNPVRTIRQTLEAPIRLHGKASGRRAIEERMAALLDMVGLSPAEEFLAKYPHQLSGGQRQRVVIARALSVDPSVLVADEATSMVDVSLRAGILQTLERLQRDSGVATVFITHDFGVARYAARGQRLAVMYLGQLVEVGATEEIIDRPRHPYTLMLRSAIPLPDPRRNRQRAKLLPVSDDIPDPVDLPVGCSLAGRCPFATDVCRRESPPLAAVDDTGHLSACHHVDRIADAAADLAAGREVQPS